ncbi:MAG TPA: MlaD family protein [Planctomycetota bacterium]|nr:MlaD family protein [Planctomycetota bacterium]
MKTSKAEFAVGLFVLAGLVVIAGLIVFFTKTVRLSRTRYEVSAVFDGLPRMDVGTPVSHLSIDVGALKEKAVTADGTKVRLVVAVNYDRQIPAGARLAVRPTGILGDYYLEFAGGDPKKGYLPRDGSAQVEGIPMITVDEVVGRLVDFVAKLEAQLDSFGGNLTALSANLNEVLGDEEFRTDIKQTVAEMPETVRAYRETAGQFQETAKRFDEAAAEAKDLLTRIRKLTENTDARIDRQSENLDKLTTALVKTTGNLDETLRSLDEILKRMQAGKGSIGALLNRDDLHEKMVKTVERMNEALIGIREMTDAIRRKWGR